MCDDDENKQTTKYHKILIIIQQKKWRKEIKQIDCFFLVLVVEFLGCCRCCFHLFCYTSRFFKNKKYLIFHFQKIFSSKNHLKTSTKSFVSKRKLLSVHGFWIISGLLTQSANQPLGILFSIQNAYAYCPS